MAHQEEAALTACVMWNEKNKLQRLKKGDRFADQSVNEFANHGDVLGPDLPINVHGSILIRHLRKRIGTPRYRSKSLPPAFATR